MRKVTPKQMFIGSLDPRVKDRLNTDAAERGASVNDTAVQILAEHFRIRFEPTGRRGPGTRGGTTDSFRVPQALYMKIGYAALRENTPKWKVVERVLADHYSIELDAVAA